MPPRCPPRETSRWRSRSSPRRAGSVKSASRRRTGPGPRWPTRAATGRWPTASPPSDPPGWRAGADLRDRRRASARTAAHELRRRQEVVVLRETLRIGHRLYFSRQRGGITRVSSVTVSGRAVEVGSRPDEGGPGSGTRPWWPGSFWRPLPHGGCGARRRGGRRRSPANEASTRAQAEEALTT